MHALGSAAQLGHLSGAAFKLVESSFRGHISRVSVVIGVFFACGARGPGEIIADAGMAGGCALCASPDFQRGGFGPRTMIICDQCEREFHIGCLAEAGRAQLTELPEGARARAHARACSGSLPQRITLHPSRALQCPVLSGLPSDLACPVMAPATGLLCYATCEL